jgi:hypothetical protein
MTDKRLRTVDSRALFSRVADTQMTTRDHLNRQEIFAQGDKADTLFYIRNGNVKLTVASRTGRKAVIALLRPTTFWVMKGQSILVWVRYFKNFRLKFFPGANKHAIKNAANQ